MQKFRSFLLALASIAVMAIPILASDPFMAPAEASGSMQVKLYPTEGIPTGTPHVVTFGVPFTRGSITDVSKVRVLKGSAEIPANVQVQTPWHHLHNAAIDGHSVRVARIQLNYTFTAVYPNFETVIVEWGLNARTQNIATSVKARTAWHMVTTGTFTAADSVWEPDVYAVLPKDVMCKGVFKPTRMLPWSSTVADTLDRAAWVDTHMTHIKIPDYTGYDLAQKNLTYSFMGLDPSGTGDYMNIRTDFAAWLFDRASTIYVAYFRGGVFKFLREAVRNADYYQHRIYRSGRAQGAFIPKNPDPAGYIGSNGCMYSTLENTAYTTWCTGDDSAITLVPIMTALFDGPMNDEPTRWSPNGGWGQERHTSFELMCNVIGFELTGNATNKTNALRIMGDYIWLQNGASGQIDSILRAQGQDPSKKIDGAMYHFGRQHASDWADDSLGASPWMSCLAIDVSLRLYHMEESDSLGNFIRRYGSFLARIMQTYNDVPHGTSWILDPYVVMWNGLPTVDMDPWSDPAHTPEIGCSIAWGNYFADILNQHDNVVDQRADTFYQAALDEFDGFGVRPGGAPEYYVNTPPRMLSWMLRPSGSWSWLGSQSGPVNIEDQSLPATGDESLVNAPNPFNPETRFTFRMPAAGKVTLSLYRLDGKLVSRPVQRTVREGENSITWKAGNMATGIYIARLQYGDKILTRQVLLIK